ncbi:hypothetical protein D3C83_150810 [compost metagenome]
MRVPSGGQKMVAVPIFLKKYGNFWKIPMLALKDRPQRFQLQMRLEVWQLVLDKSLISMPMFVQ